MEAQRERIEKINIEHGRVAGVEYRGPSQPELISGVPSQPLPAHCRVRLQLKPSEESEIAVEIWLPTENWNGKFLGTGNGGYAGTIQEMALANGLRRGYATANTDMGTSSEIDDLIGKPERWKDFGYRATHLMTVAAKQVIGEFYGCQPTYSYFTGGSTGGQQALMEAQRYPEDYNGILAVAPAFNRTHLHYGFIWNWLALTEHKDSGMSQEDARALTEFLLKKYKEEGNCLPGDCFFTCPQFVQMDPAVLSQCTALNENQRNALRKIMQGPADPVTGKRIMTPLYTPGSEAELLGLDVQSQKEVFAHDFFYLFRWVYGKDYNFRVFDFHSDVERLDQVLGESLNAVSTDLRAFKSAGGKLFMVHGMADPIIPYRNSLEYYEQTVNHMGGMEKTKDFFRCIMIPGFGHTMGGPGVQDVAGQGFRATPRDAKHDALIALTEWVEQGIAPEQLSAVAFQGGDIINGVTGDTYEYERISYVYPDYAQYIGGDANDETSYQRVNAMKQRC